MWVAISAAVLELQEAMLRPLLGWGVMRSGVRTTTHGVHIDDTGAVWSFLLGLPRAHTAQMFLFIYLERPFAFQLCGQAVVAGVCPSPPRYGHAFLHITQRVQRLLIGFQHVLLSQALAPLAGRQLMRPILSFCFVATYRWVPERLIRNSGVFPLVFSRVGGVVLLSGP